MKNMRKHNDFDSFSINVWFLLEIIVFSHVFHCFMLFFFVFPWFSLNFLNFLWFSLVFLGFQIFFVRFPLVFCGFLWIRWFFLGFRWFSVFICEKNRFGYRPLYCYRSLGPGAPNRDKRTGPGAPNRDKRSLVKGYKYITCISAYAEVANAGQWEEYNLPSSTTHQRCCQGVLPRASQGACLIVGGKRPSGRVGI